MKILIYTCAPFSSSYCEKGRKEYEKRLGRYCKIKHVLIKNEKQLEKKAAALESPSSGSGKSRFVWVHSGLEKSTMDSPALAGWVEEAGLQGVSRLVFFVGGAKKGSLSPALSRLSPCSLSISAMEMEADLLSLILEEQLYRACRIIHGEPYHK